METEGLWRLYQLLGFYYFDLLLIHLVSRLIISHCLESSKLLLELFLIDILGLVHSLEKV